METRRLRPLILPPHPRRNRYSPVWDGGEGMLPAGANAVKKLINAVKCENYLRKGSASFSGSGYVSPWVSTVTLAMIWSFLGLLVIMLRG